MGLLSNKTNHQGGRPICRAAFFRIFNNPFYYGETVYSGVRYKGSHTPMVTKAEFIRVQDIINKRGKQHPVLREFAYTGMIQCGRCGCQITAEVQKATRTTVVLIAKGSVTRRDFELKRLSGNLTTYFSYWILILNFKSGV